MVAGRSTFAAGTGAGAEAAAADMGATEIERMGAGITATEGADKDSAATGGKDNGLFNGMVGECRMGMGADARGELTGAK